MILITGASNNHYYTLIEFLKSIIKHIDLKINTVVVYNLGIDDKRWNDLKNKFSSSSLKGLDTFIFKHFDYSKYPKWFDININAGEYAWKPAIIYETFLEYNNELIIWMDSGNLILDNLDKLKYLLDNDYIHSGITSGTIKDWTHIKTIEFMKPIDLSKVNRNGACIGFNCKISWVRDFITEFYKHAINKDCIAPVGSSRLNHRQDQSIFTILFYKYQDKYKFKGYSNHHWKTYCGYSIHNDLGGSSNSR